MAAAKPTLVVSGNCQARVIWQALAESAEVKADYRPVYVRNFRKGDQGEARPEDLRDCALLLEQIAHKAPEMPGKESLPPHNRLIRYPILWLGSLWPLHSDGPRKASAASRQDDANPYGDRLILDLLDEGLGSDEAVRRWLETDVPALVDLDRLHEILEQKARLLDTRADVKLGGLVQDGFREQRLFVSRNHFSKAMFQQTLELVFAEIGLPAPELDLAKALRGMGDFEVPIHPSVAAHFGLRWWSADMSFAYNGKPLGMEAYLRRYAASQ